MRIRCIKPEFWVSESIGRLSREARLLFIGLWSFADDSGRARGVFAAISGTLFPYDSDALQLIPKWFAELEREGMVFRYKAEDGNTYYQLPNWLKHQKIEKPSTSKIPAFTEDSPRIHRILPDPYPLDQGSGIRDQGSRDQGSIAAKAASANSSNTSNECKESKPRERNPAFDALCSVIGAVAPFTKSEGSRIGGSLKQIRGTMLDATLNDVADEIRKRAANYALLFSGATLTDTALVKFWSQLATPPPNAITHANPSNRNSSNRMSAHEQRQIDCDPNRNGAKPHDLNSPLPFA